ncbi:hypothetical protein U1Q18_016248 [Sarracenia purpurea var. burkii]
MHKENHRSSLCRRRNWEGGEEIQTPASIPADKPPVGASDLDRDLERGSSATKLAGEEEGGGGVGVHIKTQQNQSMGKAPETTRLPREGIWFLRVQSAANGAADFEGLALHSTTSALEKPEMGIWRIKLGLQRLLKLGHAAVGLRSMTIGLGQPK